MELVDWLATDPTGSGDSDVLILGDLNAYGMEDPIDAITDDGYTRLAIPVDYSFVFIGGGERGPMLDNRTPEPDHLIAAAHDMIPRLRDRASECERTARIPEETIQELIDLRLFDITKPKRYGGLEMGWDVFGEVAIKIATGCGALSRPHSSAMA